jgi:DNA-binding NarL/FixJ family response regulator
MKSLDDRDIVLVVDDSADELGMLTCALEDAGLAVLVARDGRRALSLVGRVTPHVVLMDAVMPGIDGFETCRRLKTRADLANVPVIFMTGLSDTEDVLRGLRAGGVDYVTKPVAPDELIARIGVHLANARLADSARAALDAAGRSVMAVNRDIEILWCTPQAALLAAAAGCQAPDGLVSLPEAVHAGVSRLIQGADPRRAPQSFSTGDREGLQLTYMGQTGPDEFLFRVADGRRPDDLATIEDRLGLTHREAEVLLWISQGKSNRDIGDILGVSPRTVNKHLEQIFVKLGVENRTSAAILAVRTLTVVSVN